MIRRQLKLGHQYLVQEVAHTTDDDLLHTLVRITAQLPDSHLPQGYSSVVAIGLSGRYLDHTVLIQGRFLLQPERPPVCNCHAYNWPHRLNSGKCFAASKGPFCGSCGQPSSTNIITGRSKCCSARLFRDPLLQEQL